MKDFRSTLPFHAMRQDSGAFRKRPPRPFLSLFSNGDFTMTSKSLLVGKRILIVDDEPDVLETLEDLLSMCDVTKASTFDEAEELILNQDFDLAVLDIMGVDGYRLLEIAVERKVMVVMLTAHALSPQNTIKAYQEGAASYVPKDEMPNIDVFLNDILEAKEKGKSLWWRWRDRLGSYYSKKFGTEWKEKAKGAEFWEKIGYW
jgi:CheY-like chemotaxis protein